MSDTDGITNERIFDFFRSRILSLGVDSQAIYRRALSSLDAFLSEHGFELSCLSETMVLDWTAELLADGFSLSSAVQFVDVLSSSVNSAAKEGLMNPTEVVKTAKARVLAHRSELGLGDNPQILTNLLALMRMSLGAQSRYRDLLLFSLLNGGMPLMEVAMLKRADLEPMDETSRMVGERNLGESRRQYVFDLEQSSLTPRQLQRKVYELILNLLQRYVDRKITNVDDAVASLWVLLALKCGTTPAVALGCVPEHADLYQPGFVSRAAVGDEVRAELRSAVASLILNNPLRWYAMHLRRNVKYEELQSALRDMKTAPELYYPSEVIAKKVRKKLVYQNQPFIRNVVFFRSRATDIQPLFRNIGDLAWCYRIAGTPGAPYAVIPQSQIADFQAAVGQFTEETEILPLNIPAADDEVVVISSMWGERKGRFERPIIDKSGKILYRIILTPDSGFAFRIDADPRNVKPI